MPKAPESCCLCGVGRKQQTCHGKDVPCKDTKTESKIVSFTKHSSLASRETWRCLGIHTSFIYPDASNVHASAMCLLPRLDHHMEVIKWLKMEKTTLPHIWQFVRAELGDGHLPTLEGEPAGAWPLGHPCSRAQQQATAGGLKPCGLRPCHLPALRCTAAGGGHTARWKHPTRVSLHQPGTPSTGWLPRLTLGARLCPPALTRTGVPGPSSPRAEAAVARSSTRGTRCPKCKPPWVTSAHQDDDFGPTRTQPLSSSSS